MKSPANYRHQSHPIPPQVNSIIHTTFNFFKSYHAFIFSSSF